MTGPRDGDEPIAEMNVIPFIDICLVLLIIVLVTATFSTQLLDFDHPRAAKTEYVEASGAVTVDVGTDGRCRLDGKTVEVGALRAELEARGGAEVVLRSSARTASRHVVAAADQVKAAGGRRLAFAVSE